MARGGGRRRGPRSAADPDGFVACTLEAFAFLEPRFSPAVVWDEPHLALVRYTAADDTTVEVVRERTRGYELYVTIGCRTSASGQPVIEALPLQDVIAVDHDLVDVGFRPFMVRPDDAALLRRCVDQLARWTRRFAGPAIVGDERFLERLGEHRARRRVAQRLAEVRRHAGTAWRDRDFRAVVAVYEAFAASDPHIELPPLDAGRLRYARKAAADGR